jgi:hypothetical protein
MSSTQSRHRSFRITRSVCPNCHGHETTIDWSAISNLVRVPIAMLTGAVLFPFVRIVIRCRECHHRFLPTD